jgi:hypothetical protein
MDEAVADLEAMKIKTVEMMIDRDQRRPVVEETQGSPRTVAPRGWMEKDVPSR